MTPLRQRQRLQQIVSIALLSAYLLALAMAALPALHERLHADADEPTHQCAAVTVLHAQVDAPPAAEITADAAARSWEETQFVLQASRVAPLFLVVGVLEHAPPAAG